LHKYGFEDFEEAPPNGAEQKAITRFGISSMNKKNLEVIFSKSFVFIGGPTRTRTWDQRIMSPIFSLINIIQDSITLASVMLNIHHKQ